MQLQHRKRDNDDWSFLSTLEQVTEHHDARLRRIRDRHAFLPACIKLAAHVLREIGREELMDQLIVHKCSISRRFTGGLHANG